MLMASNKALTLHCFLFYFIGEKKEGVCKGVEGAVN